jgi:hypothetical protein
MVVVPMPLPASELVERRRSFDCGAQVDSHGAEQVFGRFAQAVACDAARCAPHDLGRGA